ncbi:hypothetical protein RRG08_009445 [Elysia crispata]|uniref:Ig-like and fibronectin type-III domain-containing protein C25G4.10 n=1 Tax=Elysia crispata TaxID=231223 RepID=A0AAE0YTR1_9GAST|nr:hypothetical protein RRG08_009445 [Elysia crispata]
MRLVNFEVFIEGSSSASPGRYSRETPNLLLGRRVQGQVMMGCWTSQALVVTLVALLCAVSVQAATDPVIISPPQTVQENVGSTAVLKCRIQNLGDYQVTWTFVSHDFVIFEDGALMTSHPSKYTLLNAHGYIYDLQILDVELSDQGFYKCSAGPASIISHLDVIEMEDLPMPNDPDGINVTDCCVAKGVSEACLPSCYPPNISLSTFDIVDKCGASSDVISLIDCFSDGSNHDTCCLSRGVDIACLDFCHNSLRLTSETAICLNDSQVNTLLSCAVSGAELFPSAPTSVSAIAVNTGSPAILIKWAPPEKNAEAVTGYKIMYRSVTNTTYKSILIQDRGMFMYRLSKENADISANQGYSIHLVALAKHGISLGSIDIELYVGDESLHDTMSQSIDECCERRNVGSTCRTILCRSKTWSEFDTSNSLQCFPFLDSVFTCLAGERNHTGCCQAFEVTSECLPLCSGHPPRFDSSLAGCVAQMHLVEACVQQGFASQPAPPTNLMVQHVTNNLAQISFDPSTSNLTRYIVLLRTGTVSEPFELVQYLSPTTTTFVLSKLTESTFYWVRVVAETEEQDSLPSETVSFLTYSESYEEPVNRPVRLDPYDFKGCCEASGMPSLCADGCIYRVNMTDYFLPFLDTCYSHIGSVLACASDGRDHRNCCRRRNINEACEDLCVHTKRGPLDSKYVPVCVPETATAVFCYSEGLWSLPRYPNVVVTDVSNHTITLNWTHPISGAIVDSYSISYKPVNADQEKTRKMMTTKLGYILQDLQPATAYEINVFSVNENGTSAPSPTITEYTLEYASPEIPVNITVEPQGRAFWQNITHCCKSTVSETCRDLCLNKQSAMDQSGICFRESNTMLACLSDGQDHRLCCEERNLPSVCLSICGGNAISDSVTQATCMSYTYRDIIFSCFLERQGLIPKAPLSFFAERSDFEGLNVTLSWVTPGFCGADCYYTVYYWAEADSDNKTTQETTSTSLELTVDSINKRYKFMVVAHNSYGSGPPSATRSLYIGQYARDVKVYLNGTLKMVDQGDSATLVCSIADFPQDKEQLLVRWFFNNRRLVHIGHLLYLNDVSVKDEGTYTCEVTDYLTTSSASFYLPIKAAPRFSEMRIDSIPPGVIGRAAKIACWFRGFPNSDENAWTKDGHKLKENLSKLSMNMDQRYHTGITSYRLKIANVVESDYGDYSIRVSNKFGSTSCFVRLHNPEDENIIDVAPAVPNPRQCCAQRGVPALCQELCDFNVNVEQVLQDSKYSTCLEFFNSFITCGADGRDHTKCCQESAVLPSCQAMCRGVVPDFVESNPINLLTCIGDWQPILKCMEAGSENLPFRPENVTLSLANNGQDIVVTWSPPSLAASRVEHYIIYYSQNDSDITEHVSVSYNVFRYELKGLEAMEQYEIWIIATNKFGQSLPTSKSGIETSSFIVTSPTHLTVSHVPGSSDMILTWTMTHREYYHSFTIYYKRDTDKSYKQIPNVHGTSYTFSGLDPGKTYFAYVVGIGPVMSLPSDTVEFTTQEFGVAEEQRKKDDFDGEKIAVGVGVTLAVIALIVIIVLVFFFIFKARLAPPKVDDTVAFENPGFGSSNASVKIRGIDGDSFNYGHLEEEGVSAAEVKAAQHVYENSGFENSKDASAVQAGESSSGTQCFENPTYSLSGAGDTSMTSNGTGNDSVATLELNQS